MKDLIEMVERVQRGLDALGESDEDIKRHDRWRVKHSNWLNREQSRKRLSAKSPPYAEAYARVDRDLVSKGISYLPTWLAWRLGGCSGLTKRQIERRMEKFKDDEWFQQRKGELLTEALDLLMGRRKPQAA